MTIINNLKKMHAAIIVERSKVPNPRLGPSLNAAAVKAVTGGIKSDAWKAYMAIFADNEAQLIRLSVEDPVLEKDQPWIPQMRAYMISNAICDSGTNGETGIGVDNRIDFGLASDAADGKPNQFRPPEIPKIPEVSEF